MMTGPENRSRDAMRLAQLSEARTRYRNKIMIRNRHRRVKARALVEELRAKGMGIVSRSYIRRRLQKALPELTMNAATVILNELVEDGELDRLTVDRRRYYQILDRKVSPC